MQKKNITWDELKKVVAEIRKEAGLKNSEFHSSRIAGWGNSTEGLEVTKPVFQFKYQRKWTRKVDNNTWSETVDSYVKYLGGTRSESPRFQENYKNFKELFVKKMSSFNYEAAQHGGYTVQVANPFYKKD